MVDPEATLYQSFWQRLRIDTRKYAVFTHDGVIWTSQIIGNKFDYPITIDCLQDRARENAKVPYNLNKGSCHGFACMSRIPSALKDRRTGGWPGAPFTLATSRRATRSGWVCVAAFIHQYYITIIECYDTMIIYALTLWFDLSTVSDERSCRAHSPPRVVPEEATSCRRPGLMC